MAKEWLMTLEQSGCKHFGAETVKLVLSSLTTDECDNDGEELSVAPGCPR